MKKMYLERQAKQKANGGATNPQQMQPNPDNPFEEVYFVTKPSFIDNSPHLPEMKSLLQHSDSQSSLPQNKHQHQLSVATGSKKRLMSPTVKK